MDSRSAADCFAREGYLKVDALIDSDEVGRMRGLYDRFLDGSIDTGAMRADLGAGSERKEGVKENITQIMWPSEFVPVLHDTPAYRNALRLVRDLLGDDMAFDFDMLIDKAPRSGTPTPWHQDCAYWPDLPDKRAASCWIALDESTLDNGCMWFVPKSRESRLRPHHPAGKGGGGCRAAATRLLHLSRRHHPALQPRQHHRRSPPGPHPQLPSSRDDPARARAWLRPWKKRQCAREPERRNQVRQ
jgi:hypothetical protein